MRRPRRPYGLGFQRGAQECCGSLQEGDAVCGGLAGAPGAQEHPWEPVTQLLAHPLPSPGGSLAARAPPCWGRPRGPHEPRLGLALGPAGALKPGRPRGPGAGAVFSRTDPSMHQPWAATRGAPAAARVCASKGRAAERDRGPTPVPRAQHRHSTASKVLPGCVRTTFDVGTVTHSTDGQAQGSGGPCSLGL